MDRRRFASYLETGEYEELDAHDAKPVGHHADGTPCYTPRCAKGGIPWKNIVKHNARERAQMKFDFSGKGNRPGEGGGSQDDLAQKLRRMPEAEFRKFFREHDTGEYDTPEWKAIEAERDRREDEWHKWYASVQ